MPAHSQLSGFKQQGRPKSLWTTLHLDPILFGLLLCLISSGLFILYSGSAQSIDTVIRQGSRMLVGLILMMVVAQIPPWVFRRWAPWLFCIGIGLLIMVIVSGTKAKGAQRWLSLPGLPQFQPSEIMKLVVPLTIAHYLAEKRCPIGWRASLIGFIILLVPTGLIVVQPDLGTSLLIASSGFFTLFMAGLPWRLLAILGILAPPACGILWLFMHDYQKQRVLTFLDPESDPLGAGWNIIQSKTAIGSGGVTGKGWLDGTQSQLNFLPESSTDFIIAVLAEEFGFVGCALVLLLYLAIIFRGLVIANNAQGTFARLAASAITLTFFIYVFVNIGMVSGLLPVVGVPLPLISYGGTSVVTLMVGFGIVMSVHTHRTFVSR